MRAVTGKVWFAETGGIVKRVNATHVNFVQGANHAAKVDRVIFRTLAKLSPRIPRVDLYEWKAVSSTDTWDSALISWNDSVRPAYDVLANTLDAWGIRPDCALSLVPPGCAGFAKYDGRTRARARPVSPSHRARRRSQQRDLCALAALQP